MSQSMNLSELQERVEYIRSLCRQYKIVLPSVGGLCQALDQAGALCVGMRLPDEANGSSATILARDVHVMWTLAEDLKVCVQAGLDVKGHLNQIKTGTTDYGIPDDGSGRSIFFKDFTCEVSMAADLIRKGHRPEFCNPANDPRGDLVLNGVWISVKHPNSTGQLEKLARKFQKELLHDASYGVFAVGIEDIFHLGEQPSFADQVAYDGWLRPKRIEIESFGRDFLSFVSKRNKILGAIHTSTTVSFIGGVSQLSRLGNACLFDHHRGIPAAALQAASSTRILCCSRIR